ncbi:hypothetical protein D3C84_595440 [compost metagenome]
MSQASTEQFDQLSADRQANPQATVFTGHRAVELEEPLVHRRLSQIGEADARINHGKAQRQTIELGRLAGHPQRQATDTGELDGVVQQAFQALRNLDAVPLHTIR